MENFFDFENLPEPEYPEMSKDEFIEKAKKFFKLLEDSYARSFKNVPEGEEESCDRCGGFTQIEQGGDSVDCPVCNGEGIKLSRVFDEGEFGIEVEDIMWNQSNYCDLLFCKIK